MIDKHQNIVLVTSDWLVDYSLFFKTRKVNKTYTYCPPEIEKAMKKAPAERKQTVVENLIRGGVCKNLLSHKHDHNTNDKLMSSCRHLLGKVRIKYHLIRTDDWSDLTLNSLINN